MLALREQINSMQEMQATKAADAEAAAKKLQDENAKLRQAAKTNEDRNAVRIELTISLDINRFDTRSITVVVTNDGQ